MLWYISRLCCHGPPLKWVFLPALESYWINIYLKFCVGHRSVAEPLRLQKLRSMRWQNALKRIKAFQPDDLLLVASSWLKRLPQILRGYDKATRSRQLARCWEDCRMHKQWEQRERRCVARLHFCCTWHVWFQSKRLHLKFAHAQTVCQTPLEEETADFFRQQASGCVCFGNKLCDEPK